MYLLQTPQPPERINVTAERFEIIFFANKYKRVRIPTGKIGYYEFNVLNGDKIVGYYTETSYENTYQADYDLCGKEDLLYHYSREMYYMQQAIDGWKRAYENLRDGVVPPKNVGAGLYQFMEDENVPKYSMGPMFEEFIDNITNKDADGRPTN